MMKISRRNIKTIIAVKLFTLFNKYLFCIYYVVLGTFLVLGIQLEGGGVGKTQNKQTQHYVPVYKRYNSRKKNRKREKLYFSGNESVLY